MKRQKIFIKHWSKYYTHIDAIKPNMVTKIIENLGRSTNKLRGDANFEVETTLVGEGLHRRVVKSIRLVEDLIGISKEPCNMIVMDYLTEDTYIDLDEMTQDVDTGFYTFDVLDIEKPTSNSIQHIVFFKFPLNRSQHLLKYPIHFRYQNPSMNTSVTSKMLSKSQVFVDCISDTNLEWEDDLEYGSFDGFFARKLFGNHYEKLPVTNRISTKGGNFEQKEIIYKEIPVGNKRDKELVTTVTIAITVIASLIITYTITRSNTNPNKRTF